MILDFRVSLHRHAFITPRIHGVIKLHMTIYYYILDNLINVNNNKASQCQLTIKWLATSAIRSTAARLPQPLNGAITAESSSAVKLSRLPALTPTSILPLLSRATKLKMSKIKAASLYIYFKSGRLMPCYQRAGALVISHRPPRQYH